MVFGSGLVGWAPVSEELIEGIKPVRAHWTHRKLSSIVGFLAFVGDSGGG